MQFRFLRSARIWALPAAIFGYLLFLRTYAISTTFWMAGDQERDWVFAMAPLRELRLTGPPSVAGGTTLGPIWYWLLWTCRHLIGPWTTNFPHAGAIGIGIVQSAADVFLFAAIRKRTGSAWLALGIVLLAATVPQDIALTRAMWNPELASALIKVTIGLVLVAGEALSPWSVAGIAIVAWLAVQAHSTAICVAAPLFCALVGQEVVAGRLASAIARGRLIAEIVVVLQIPYFASMILNPSETLVPFRAIDGASATLSHPASMGVREVFGAVTSGGAGVLTAPFNVPFAGWLLAAFVIAVGAVWLRRDLLLASVTVVPLGMFLLAFLVTQLPLDGYYFLPPLSALAMTIGLGVMTVPRAARPLGIALACGVIALQPWRASEGLTAVRFPEYGALARGSREIMRRTPDVRNIDLAFKIPDSTDPLLLYRILGGEVLPTSRYLARIEVDGGVTFTLVSP